MKLVIVESPTKSKTIEKFLGKDYKVLASFGHIRDLPKSALGIDTENNFQPKYVIPTKSRAHLSELKKAAAKADEIYLSTDPDREGEAIAWHVAEALKLKDYKRITFHEITQGAISEAIEHPRQLDMHLVDAQQARRVLDRLVGYKLSPLLWRKLAKGLSAGRVQSVALRLICERENEIRKFQPLEYWSISAALKKADSEKIFEAKLAQKAGKAIDKLEIKNKTEAENITKSLEGGVWLVKNIERKDSHKSPAAPFTTSTLQQEAFNRLHLPSKVTMILAQQLYEQGLITYHRTDSTNISAQAMEAARNFISQTYGPNYLSQTPRVYKTKSKNAQEAHEAIRPSYVDNSPESLSSKLEAKQLKLYELIWRRFVATQAKEAIFDAVRADIEVADCVFRANGQTLKFDGFLKINPLKFKEMELPLLAKGEKLNLQELKPEQHFTEPPPRYTDASIIKTLEELGIGRPSTYAPIIAVLLKRNYVIRGKSRQFEPTEIGERVTALLVEHFPAIVDLQFTAKMEDQLDDVAEGHQDWVELIRLFYIPFEETLKSKYLEIKKEKIEEPTEKICPDCGGQIFIKSGRFGKFYACSKFPECKYTAPMEIPGTGVKCPKCHEGEIMPRRSKRGRVFYSCSRWPNCDFALWNKPTGETCPKCQSLLVYAGKNQIKCSNKECDHKQEALAPEESE
ncbi:MAG: type I DNA topoisomerase [Candidatus Paceibacterota bacterium]